ncbi:MAG: ABC transporter permease [Pseudomonadota bacterium]|nr:ABC transporter permease [Pseudomonadota bacterium]
MALLNFSPIAKRRWAAFKAHKRGYFSAWVFFLALFLSLFAEVIANDKPILILHEEGVFVPVYNDYTVGDFGVDDGPRSSVTVDYTNKEIFDRVVGSDENATVIWPPIRWHFSTQDLSGNNPAAPSSEHLLGTTDKGYDVAAVVIYAFRVSVLFGLALAVASMSIGVVIGAIQGFYGGWIDLIGQRLIEIWSSMPSLYVLIIVSASIGLQGFNFATLATLLLILLAFSWTGAVGAVRAEVLRTRKMDYVQAARVMGMSEKRIMFRHVLPNALVATITFLPFSIAGSVTALTSLDFLGFGLPPGSPSLGELMLQGKNNPDAIWLWLTSFVALMLLLSLLMFMGEAVRDAFDPRKTLGKGA